MYGHQLSSKWIHQKIGNPERRILQSVILMEYVNGGSLKLADANMIVAELVTCPGFASGHYED
ncbi:hypothetical protein NC652_024373 [Populus alba x Populus x berolinensis]|nr:hypothetical protein NC652_024373 [Populus alba x Populus x berolinensis]